MVNLRNLVIVVNVFGERNLSYVMQALRSVKGDVAIKVLSELNRKIPIVGLIVGSKIADLIEKERNETNRRDLIEYVCKLRYYDDKWSCIHRSRIKVTVKINFKHQLPEMCTKDIKNITSTR